VFTFNRLKLANVVIKQACLKRACLMTTNALNCLMQQKCYWAMINFVLFCLTSFQILQYIPEQNQFLSFFKNRNRSRPTLK